MKCFAKEKIVINKDYSLIEDFLYSLPQTFYDEGGETIYQDRNTIKVFTTNGINLNVKSFKKPHFINQFVYATLRKSKAERSYTYATKLKELGVNTPTPIAYIEYGNKLLFKDSMYVSEQIEVDGEIRVLNKGSLEEHKQLIIAFAYFTAQMHNLGIMHLDYSPGNILFKKEDDKFNFYLVDLNRMKFDQTITDKTAAYSFRRLSGSDEMIDFFTREYAKARGLDTDSCVKEVFKYRFQKSDDNETSTEDLIKSVEERCGKVPEFF